MTILGYGEDTCIRIRENLHIQCPSQFTEVFKVTTVAFYSEDEDS